DLGHGECRTGFGHRGRAQWRSREQCRRRSIPGPGAMTRQGGFTYLFLLFTIAIVSVGLVGAASVHHYTERRQAEAELLRIGREFQAALASYRAVGSTRELPLTLDELLEDERGGVLHRHLRKIHRDPVTRQAEW